MTDDRMDIELGPRGKPRPERAQDPAPEDRDPNQAAAWLTGKLEAVHPDPREQLALAALALQPTSRAVVTLPVGQYGTADLRGLARLLDSLANSESPSPGESWSQVLRANETARALLGDLSRKLTAEARVHDSAFRTALDSGYAAAPPHPHQEDVGESKEDGEAEAS